MFYVCPNNLSVNDCAAGPLLHVTSFWDTTYYYETIPAKDKYTVQCVHDDLGLVLSSLQSLCIFFWGSSWHLTYPINPKTQNVRQMAHSCETKVVWFSSPCFRSLCCQGHTMGPQQLLSMCQVWEWKSVISYIILIFALGFIILVLWTNNKGDYTNRLLLCSNTDRSVAHQITLRR